MSFSERIETWRKAMLSPATAFADEAAKGERGLKDGIENYGTPILLVYLPLTIIGMIILGQLNIMLPIAAIFAIGMMAAATLVVTLIFTAISYLVSMLMGGKAQFGRLYYMISLPFAPLYTVSGMVAILVTIINALLGKMLGGALSMASSLASLVLALYGLYLLTLSLDALYKYGKPKAVIAWLVPTAAMIGIVLLIFGMALLSILGLAAKGY